MKYLSEAKKSLVVLFYFSEIPSNHNNHRQTIPSKSVR